MRQALSTPPGNAAGPLLTAIVQQATAACGAPIGLITMVDPQGTTVTVQVGWPAASPPPDAWALLRGMDTQDSDAVFEVPDARLDPRWCADPLVTGAPGIRFLAGVALRLGSGERVGTLCVIDPQGDPQSDRQTRSLSTAQAQALQGLAVIAGQAIDLQRSANDARLPDADSDASADSDARYRAIVEAQDEMISLATAEGTLVYVNPAYARHFGKTPTAMIGGDLYAYVEPLDREFVRGLLADVMRSGVSMHSENRMRGADGSERWVAWTNGVQTDAGQQRLLHSVGRDITARKQAELALRASEAFLERTGRVAGVGGWELDLISGKVTWSAETRRIHGVTAGYEPTLETALDFYTAEARPLIEAAARRGIDAGEPWDLELPFVTADGRSIWVRAVGEAAFEHGQAVRLLGAFQDITERRRLEQQVAEDERFLRQITDSLPLRIAYLDRERRYRFVNLDMLRLFGRERADVLGRTRAELRPDADDSYWAERAHAALAGEAQQFEYEEQRDGQTLRFENKLIPDRAPSGEVRGYFLTGIDITQRNDAVRTLRELTTIFDNTTDFVAQTDRRGQIVYMNPSARRAVGLQPDAPLGTRYFADFSTPATDRLFAETIMPTVNAGAVWVGETSLNLPGRGTVPISHMVIAHRDAQGRIERYSSVMRDISAAVLGKQEALRQTDILRSVTEAIPATVVVVGIDGRYRFANSAFERACGMPRDRLLGRLTREVLGTAEAQRHAPWMKRALAGETVNFTLDYPGPEGDTYLALSFIPLRLATGVVDGFVGVSQDITPQKREEGRLLQLAQRDPLTGLLNRAGFERGLELLLQDPHHAGLAVLYIDLDDFKAVNDRHGHPAGDQVLETFAQRLAALVRPTDMVARLGGDEFAIALGGLREVAHAEAIAAKVLIAANTPFQIGPVRLNLGASVGVASSNEARPSWRDLLVQADAQLFAAKAAGKGRQFGARG